MLSNEFQCRLGSDSPNRIAIIATQQYAQIHKFLVGQIQSLQCLRIVHGLHHKFAPVRKRHFSHQDGRRKGQRVHVLRGCRVHDAPLAEGRGLGLCFAGSPQDRNAHEFQQTHAILVFLLSGSDETFGLLVLFLDVAFLRGLLEGLFGLFSFLASFGQFTALESGRFAIKDVNGTNALGQKSNGPIEESLDVGGGFAFSIGQHDSRSASTTIRTNRNEKLIYGHGSIDCDLASMQ
mmetsp:Transcript_21700/g.50085  ORF Transcript_21700/g.50085 Transcript_21700/m.50085 type:complete len:235 (-) Transcript_21700:39-743(-)